MFGRTLSFFRENGSYVFFSTLAGRPFQSMRNRMLAGKLGVRRVNIGPRPYLRGLTNITMGEDFSAGDGLWLAAITSYGDERFEPRLVIGNHVRISHWCHIACTNSVTIGNHVLIGSKVIITAANGKHFSSGHDLREREHLETQDKYNPVTTATSAKAPPNRPPNSFVRSRPDRVRGSAAGRPWRASAGSQASCVR